jgi:sensor histidine kinase YesM
VGARPRLRRLAAQWAIGFACFTAVSLLFTGQVWVDYAYAGHRITWTRALAIALCEWEPWAVLTPLIVWIAGRWPFARRRVGRRLAVHVVAAVALSAATLLFQANLTARILDARTRPFSFLKVHLTFLTYWAIVAAAQFVDHYRAARARELRASQLETELARAQVEALKMQLHPHFLFNTLNTIAGLMREDVEAADQMIAKLSELLRRTFETAGVQEVPLECELEFLDLYLTIQRARHGERLSVAIEVADDARRVLVPSLILQPLVENAIRHGVADTPGPGSLAFRASVAAGRLTLEVRNDGPAVRPDIREGGGLRNTRSRLLALYGPEATFTLRGQPSGGAAATVTLPARQAEAE